MGGDIIGEINYYLNSTTDNCPPWIISYLIETEPKRNWVQELVRVTIRDLRGKEKSVNLDANALEVLKYDGSMQEEFEEGSEEQKTYYEEISDLLKKHLGASRVLISNYIIRSRGSPRTDERYDLHHKPPLFYPHVDIAATSVSNTVEQLLGKEEGETAMQHRIQMINIWRPLGLNPITQKPLTICDYRSIDVDKDVHSFDVVKDVQSVKHPEGKHHYKAYLMSPNAQDVHIWYYLSHMRSDEMFVFKSFDSKPDVAQFAFHTAFVNENEATANVEQKSIEIRCWVFYDE